MTTGPGDTLPMDAAPVLPADPLLGSTVGSFRILRALGRGGMGTVYLAEHPVIGSRVAIKFLHESMATSPDLVGRFYDEARAVNLIGHENIVGIFDLSMLPPNRYYIVMEHLDGPTLAQRLRDGPLPRPAAREVLLQLCDALQCAHEHGVVHRDLKPDNVFVLRRRGRESFVKLVDFGIAKLRDAPQGAHTAAGMIVGTPEYMAPEQCDNRPVDARTDVYSLGVMAYQLLTGALPHTGTSVARLLLAHLQEEPRRPRDIDPSIPAPLEAAVLRALAKRPEDRFPDMAAFGRAIDEAVPAPAPATRSTPAAAAPSAGAGVPAPAPTPTPGTWPVAVRVVGEKGLRAATATEITRGGLFVRAEPPLPVPFARVEVSLARDGSAPLELHGDVVRVVTPAEAASSGLPPGFAIQFLSPTPAVRAELERMSGPPRPSPSPPLTGARWLDDLDARAGGSHYDLLGLPPDAEVKDVQSRARSLRVELEGLRQSPLSPQQAARVAPLLARLAVAAGVLGVPAERLDYDARRGNHLGVARCVAAGLPEALVAQHRADFLRERPGADAAARQCRARARVARGVGNREVALAHYEEALRADPLDLEVQQEYWQLRRESGGTPR